MSVIYAYGDHIIVQEIQEETKPSVGGIVLPDHLGKSEFSKGIVISAGQPTNEYLSSFNKGDIVYFRRNSLLPKIDGGVLIYYSDVVAVEECEDED